MAPSDMIELLCLEFIIQFGNASDDLIACIQGVSSHPGLIDSRVLLYFVEGPTGIWLVRSRFPHPAPNAQVTAKTQGGKSLP